MRFGGASTIAATAALLAVLAMALPANARQSDGVQRMAGARLRATRSVASILQAALLRRSDPAAGVAFRVALPELRQPALPPAAGKTRLQVGVHRDIVDTRARAIDGADLEWEPTADGGYTTTFAVASAGARSIQLALRVAALPVDAEARFFNPSDPVQAHGPFKSDLRVPSPEARARADGSELFWSPVISGAELGIEIFLPRSALPGELRFAMVKVAHLIHVVDTKDLSDLGNSGSCERNIACDARWTTAAASVAKIVFQSGGRSFLCTGQLIIDSDVNTERLWFLTAAHCMAKATETRSAVLFWRFQHARCAGNDIPPVVQTAGGGKLKFTTKAKGRTNDHTLMELRQTPPDGTTLAGWSREDPEELLRKTVQGSHHPSGDAKKSSIGKLAGLDGVNFTAEGLLVVEGDSHFRVRWKNKKGVTEGGSSGSALWYGTRWPRQFVIGTLSGGAASCFNTAAPDWYGSFARTYDEFGKFRRLIDPANNRE